MRLIDLLNTDKCYTNPNKEITLYKYIDKYIYIHEGRFTVKYLKEHYANEEVVTNKGSIIWIEKTPETFTVSFYDKSLIERFLVNPYDEDNIKLIALSFPEKCGTYNFTYHVSDRGDHIDVKIILTNTNKASN